MKLSSTLCRSNIATILRQRFDAAAREGAALHAAAAPLARSQRCDHQRASPAGHAGRQVVGPFPQKDIATAARCRDFTTSKIDDDGCMMMTSLLLRHADAPVQLLRYRHRRAAQFLYLASRKLGSYRPMLRTSTRFFDRRLSEMRAAIYSRLAAVAAKCVSSRNTASGHHAVARMTDYFARGDAMACRGFPLHSVACRSVAILGTGSFRPISISTPSATPQLLCHYQ